MLKDLMATAFIYQKGVKVLTSLLMEKTSMTNQLILI